MKGIGFKLFPVILIGLFIAIMTTGSFLKKPLREDDDVIYYLNHVQEDIEDEDWKSAAEYLTKTQKAWDKVVQRIQYSAERDEINMLKTTFERTNGFIRAKEKAGALAEIAEAQFIWKELGK
ncbi:MAG TPA: DUF4363 family protein [Bacillota bacterium]